MIEVAVIRMKHELVGLNAWVRTQSKFEATHLFPSVVLILHASPRDGHTILHGRAALRDRIRAEARIVRMELIGGVSGGSGYGGGSHRQDGAAIRWG